MCRSKIPSATARCALAFCVLGCSSRLVLAQATHDLQSSPTPQPGSHGVTLSARQTPDPRRAAEARNAYLAGARALDRDDLVTAATQFDRAIELDPEVIDYQIGRRLTLEHQVTALVQEADRAKQTGDATRAKVLLTQAQGLDPQNVIATQHAAASGGLPLLSTVATASQDGPPESDLGNLAASATIGGELRLAPTPGTRDIHVRGDMRSAVTQAFGAWGIRAVFDDSVTAQPIRFDLDAADFPRAIPLLLQMGRLFAVPLDAHSVLIGKDSPELRTRLERQLEETIYVPGYGTEQINELGSVLRNVFDIRQLTVQNTSSKLVVRASTLR